MKWQYQGIADTPFFSQSAARKVREVSLQSIGLFRRAIAMHGPLPGYLTSLQAVGRSYTAARAFLEREE